MRRHDVVVGRHGELGGIVAVGARVLRRLEVAGQGDLAEARVHRRLDLLDQVVPLPHGPRAGHEHVHLGEAVVPRLARAQGMEVMIISSEPNTVVATRAKKMGVEAIHGVGLKEKGRVMREVLERKNIPAENVIYIGNDLNDLPCFEVAGWSVAVADAYPDVIRSADHVLTKTGGHGALRELCDLILSRVSK